MMPDTPRLFVGPAVFELEGPIRGRLVDAIEREIAQVPGISWWQLDRATSTLLVTAKAPVDRGSVVAALEGLGVCVRP
jgi:hypothetical protein